MADGTLEALRDGKLGFGGRGLVVGMGRPGPGSKPEGDGGEAGGRGKEVVKGKGGGGVKLSGGAVSDDDGDEEMSDGGFFEE